MTPFLRIIHREIGYEPGTREIVLFSPLEIYICMYIYISIWSFKSFKRFKPLSRCCPHGWMEIMRIRLIIFRWTIVGKIKVSSKLFYKEQSLQSLYVDVRFASTLFPSGKFLN